MIICLEIYDKSFQEAIKRKVRHCDYWLAVAVAATKSTYFRREKEAENSRRGSHCDWPPPPPKAEPVCRRTMERADQRTSSTPYGGGGVGGKLRKPTSRKPPPTPYARPEQNQSHRRWLSKLVDPAYRLITGSATRLLPYLFSKSLPSNALPSPGDEDHGYLRPPPNLLSLNSLSSATCLGVSKSHYLG